MPSRQDPTRAASDALQAAFFCLPAPAAILDSTFRFVSVNKAFSTQFEYLPDEVLGRKAEFLYDPGLQQVAQNAQQFIGGDANPDFRFERLVITRSGRVLDTAVHVTGIPGGEPRQYVALYQDVADGYRKERLLLSRAEMFRLMVERSPLPISVQDRNWRLVLVNDAYCAFTGYAKSELLGQDPALLLHPPEEVVNLPAQREAILSLNTDDFPHHQVIRELIRRDGTRARYHGSLSFSRGPGGEPLWCCTLVDLSALDGLRSQLSEQTDLAGTMRLRFDRFSSLSDDGIAIVERATGRIVHVNESLCTLLGADRTTLEGASIASVWAGMSDDDAVRVAGALARTATQSHTEVTVRLPGGDSGARWVRLRAVSGEIYQSEYFLVFEDISDTVEQQRVRDRQADAQIATIVSEVHHRIKNHLQGVLNLLQPRQDADAESNAMITRAATQVAGIAQVHGILMASPARAPLSSMVVAIVEAVATLWNVPVVTSISDELLAPAYSVPEKESVPLALIVNELILNAIKHRRGAEPVNVALEPDANGVLIRISNAGSLPPGFDLSTRATASGLGLVRSLIARTSTRLTIASADGFVLSQLELSPPVIVRTGVAGTI
ncbi:MAG: PAS domain S-box protein [Burkholderiaceae bacterium]|nr:PAS domain S-box protein [Burkholderiaceae bacterium]